MISLMFYFIERDYDNEAREKFRHTLENEQPRPKPNPVQKGKKKFIPVETTGKGKWKAPAGWTPPGWNEARSYATAKAFMSFQASPK